MEFIQKPTPYFPQASLTLTLPLDATRPPSSVSPPPPRSIQILSFNPSTYAPIVAAPPVSSPILNADRVVDEYFSRFPPGYRFCPYDHELLLDYLEKKVQGLPLPRNKIVDVTLYAFHPQYLVEKYKHCGEDEWYFFTPREKKYRNGSRPNRAVDGGYWKATGKDKEIKYKKDVIGYRKSLDFYYGKPRYGTKSNWMMHEYRTLRKETSSTEDENRSKIWDDHDMRLDDWVLCKIYKKGGRKKTSTHRQEEEESSPSAAIDDSPVMHGDQMDNNIGHYDSPFMYGTEMGNNIGTGHAMENSYQMLDGFSLPQIQIGLPAAGSFYADPISMISTEFQAPSLDGTYGDLFPPISDTGNWSCDVAGITTNLAASPSNLLHTSLPLPHNPPFTNSPFHGGFSSQPTFNNSSPSSSSLPSSFCYLY